MANVVAATKVKTMAPTPVVNLIIIVGARDATTVVNNNNPIIIVGARDAAKSEEWKYLQKKIIKIYIRKFYFF